MKPQVIGMGRGDGTTILPEELSEWQKVQATELMKLMTTHGIGELTINFQLVGACPIIQPSCKLLPISKDMPPYVRKTLAFALEHLGQLMLEYALAKVTANPSQEELDKIAALWKGKSNDAVISPGPTIVEDTPPADPAAGSPGAGNGG